MLHTFFGLLAVKFGVVRSSDISDSNIRSVKGVVRSNNGLSRYKDLPFSAIQLCCERVKLTKGFSEYAKCIYETFELSMLKGLSEELKSSIEICAYFPGEIGPSANSIKSQFILNDDALYILAYILLCENISKEWKKHQLNLPEHELIRSLKPIISLEYVRSLLSTIYLTKANDMTAQVIGKLAFLICLSYQAREAFIKTHLKNTVIRKTKAS